MIKLSKQSKAALDAALLDFRNARAVSWCELKATEKRAAALPVSGSTLYKIFAAPADAVPVTAKTIFKVCDFLNVPKPRLSYEENICW